MRRTHILLVAASAAVVAALAVKTTFISAPKAEADPIAGSLTTGSVFDLHRNYPNLKDLPVQEIKDPM